MTRYARFRQAGLPDDAHSPLDSAVAARDADTITMVRDALAHQEVLLSYQPVMSVHRPGATAFYEGLIRVLDSTGRVIPARNFMPQIEDTPLSRDIDVIALRLGLKALHRTPTLRLSINMSARSIGYKAWSRLLDVALQRDPTIGERLILEITESSVMVVPEQVSDLMDAFQNRGVCFALDHFGAGALALRYLKDLYFDVVKIDGRFVRGIAKDADNRHLTKALLTVAGHFDMMTVATSVENAQDAEALTKLGVDCMQGYYLSAPTTQPDWLRSARSNAAG